MGFQWFLKKKRKIESCVGREEGMGLRILSMHIIKTPFMKL